jgi:hypothetical protein
MQVCWPQNQARKLKEMRVFNAASGASNAALIDDLEVKMSEEKSPLLSIIL